MTDKVSGVFVPIVVMIAVATFITWYFFVDPGNVTSALVPTISILVIACPCALGLATPTSIMAGSGRAAEKGLLFKGGEYLETAGSIDTVVLDKTGTITKGEPTLVAVEFPEKEDYYLKLVASVESYSEHPIAEAIVLGAKERQISILDVDQFQSIPGHGVKATVENRKVIIGNRALMDLERIEINPLYYNQLEFHERNGETAMLVAVEQKCVGIVSVADTVKETSKDAVAALQQLGLEVMMLTGDNKLAAQSIANQVGIDHVIAEVHPEQKSEAIDQLKSQGRKVAMVGDGINDAPALVTANIGMAIGTGTDIAIEAADITLMRGDLRSVAEAIILSRKTMKNIKQNLFFAFVYNSCGIPIAAAGLLAPWLAGAAMAFSSVSVVLNALRLQKA